MKKIAILQSNYIPWKGYFDLINSVDEFVLYDTAQYTKNDWRNRNKIKTSQGIQWLTIPIRQENLHQKIQDTKISDAKWNVKHWRAVTQNYAKAKHFKEYKELFESLYLECDDVYLSQINFRFMTAINAILGITTKIRWSSEFDLRDGKTQRLLGICQECQANVYVSGPSAKNYLDENLLREENINVEWMDYRGYNEYQQLFTPFDHGVSILDLIFNEGSNATHCMRSFS